MNGSAPVSTQSTLIPTLILVFVTLCWGTSFTLMKDWHDLSQACPGGPIVAGLTMIALRMVFGLAVLAVCRPTLFTRSSFRARRAGVIVGLTFFAGFALQVTGLAKTTPARSGFITSLSSAFVPVGMWLFFRSRVAGVTVIGLAIGVAGAGLLSLGSSDAGHESAAALIGDGLTLIAAFFFAAQVILLERLGRTIEPTYITVTFFLTCGVLSLTGALLGAGSDTGVRAWAVWIVRMFAEPHMPVKFAVLTVVCTVLAFGLMNAYQPRVPASRAALIYLLESVFSSLISVLAGFDRLTWLLLMGGGLILFGNLMVELPTILRGPRRLSGTTGLSLADEIHRP